MPQPELPFPCGKQPDKPQFFNNRPIEINNWTLHLINAEELHSGNVVVLKKNNFNLIIDSGCNIAANIKKLTKKVKPKQDSKTFLINTHGHPDHTGANAILAQDGAIVVSHRQAKKMMRKVGGVEDQGLPSITYRKKMNISLGNQLIHLIHLPSGHTNGDTAVWIPKLNILHTGDALMGDDYPLIDINAGASINMLIKAISKLINLSDNETIIIPGHGNLMNRFDLLDYRQMLRSITADIERMKAKGFTLEEVVDKKPTKDYDAKWGSGKLVNGERFTGFIYNTLTIENVSKNNDSGHNKESLSSKHNNTQPNHNDLLTNYTNKNSDNKHNSLGIDSGLSPKTNKILGTEGSELLGFIEIDLTDNEKVRDEKRLDTDFCSNARNGNQLLLPHEYHGADISSKEQVVSLWTRTDELNDFGTNTDQSDSILSGKTRNLSDLC